MATHYGSMAAWTDVGTNPTTCLSNGGVCYNTSGGIPSGFNLEATSHPHSTNNCGMTATNPEARWPLSAMRFLWDVFDDHNDADGDTYSAHHGDFWQHISLMQFYPGGTGVNQHEEPWNSSKTSVAEPNGRGSLSYEHNYAASAGLTDVFLLWADNCSPP
jgi:hypothetical protein